MRRAAGILFRDGLDGREMRETHSERERGVLDVEIERGGMGAVGEEEAKRRIPRVGLVPCDPDSS